MTFAFLCAYVVPARATTFVVRSLSDSGPDSFRQAILDANANPLVDTISFDLAGPGVHSIQPLSELPQLTGPTIIDGTTQPGYAGAPVIELSGQSAGPVNGLWFAAGSDGSTVRALVINRFAGNALVILSGRNTVTANYIGTNAAGDVTAPNSLGALEIFGGEGNVIGGTTAGTGNVLQTSIDVFDAPYTVIAGNFIGTNAAGTASLGQPAPLFIGSGSSFTTIGGPSLAARNIIIGSVVVNGGTGTVIQGNHVGTDVTGQVPLAPIGVSVGISLEGTGHVLGGPTPLHRNIIAGGIQFYEGAGHTVLGNFVGVAADGVTSIGRGSGRIEFFPYTVSAVRIGDVHPGTGNVIDGGFGHAVGITEAATGVSVRGNIMINSRARYGIDLNRNGPTPNDPADDDVGANKLQNHPVLVSATFTGSVMAVRGILKSTPSTTFLIDLYSNSDATAGRNRITWVGMTTITTDRLGEATFTFAANSGPILVTATATDPDGNTSEFSTPLAVDQLSIPTASFPALLILVLSLAGVAILTLHGNT